METLLPPQPLFSAIALSAVVAVIALGLIRFFPPARARVSRQQPLAGPTRTDNPYDGILAKAELLLTYAADNGMEVGEAERRAVYNFRLTDKKDQNADTVDALSGIYEAVQGGYTADCRKHQ